VYFTVFFSIIFAVVTGQYRLQNDLTLSSEAGNYTHSLTQHATGVPVTRWWTDSGLN